MALVAPHGGTLVDPLTADPAGLRARAARLPRVTLDARELADLELIATGAASPLVGFAGKADYDSILATTRLASGIVWPVPLTLAVGPAVTTGDVALYDARGRLWGILHITEVFERDTARELDAVYGTRDRSHPGVAYTLARPTRLAGGAVEVLPLPDDRPFATYRHTPRSLRAELALRGWCRVAGFHTNDPIHRADEHLTRLALELSDGLVIHAVLGEAGMSVEEVPAAIRFATYEALVERYYPAERTILAAVPLAPRFAGPRDALFHALVRKNYGIDQLIIGRDRDGDPARDIFDQFAPIDLGVTPLRFDASFFCTACESLASSRTCAHASAQRVELSRAQIRELLRAGEPVPREVTRPEVAALLRAYYLTAVPAPISASPPVPGDGFILWFTGLSGSGKSTLATALARALAPERPLEILDGDEVRTHLSRGLGFTKEDRDVNVHRIGFVARTLAQHGVGVITAAISPYAETRREVRELAEQRGIPVIEVFANATLEALVTRDAKGLYKQALAGNVAHFTGVSDPYEPPTAPDVEVRTDIETVEQSVAKIIAVLRARNLVSPLPITPATLHAHPRAEN